MESSIIYVQNTNGEPLMPTRRHNKVWYWLRKGLARVVSREPFTIRLRFETTEYTQKAVVGVDTGSQAVGIAAITNGEVVFQAQVHLRTDIKGKLDQRRQYRHSRRKRKTRYRPARFANRCRPQGWLAPSLRSKADCVVCREASIRVSMACTVNTGVGHRAKCTGSSFTNWSKPKDRSVTLQDGERREPSSSKT
jgi:hypothetical protein